MNESTAYIIVLCLIVFFSYVGDIINIEIALILFFMVVIMAYLQMIINRLEG